MFLHSNRKWKSNFLKESFFHTTSHALKCQRPSADIDAGDSLISDECRPTVQNGGYDLSLTSETTYLNILRKSG